MDEELLTGQQHVGHSAVLVDVGLELHFLKRGQTALVGEERRQVFGVRGVVRAEVEVMEECIFLIAHVDKSGIQTGHKLFHLSQVDVADGVRDVARLLL